MRCRRHKAYGSQVTAVTVAQSRSSARRGGDGRWTEGLEGGDEGVENGRIGGSKHADDGRWARSEEGGDADMPFREEGDRSTEIIDDEDDDDG